MPPAEAVSLGSYLSVLSRVTSSALLAYHPPAFSQALARMLHAICIYLGVQLYFQYEKYTKYPMQMAQRRNRNYAHSISNRTVLLSFIVGLFFVLVLFLFFKNKFYQPLELNSHTILHNNQIGNTYRRCYEPCLRCNILQPSSDSENVFSDFLSIKDASR